MERDIMGDEDMPSSVMWSEDEIQVYHFQYRSNLEKLLTNLHLVMLKILSRHPYNSVTSVVQFYEAYKQQKLPLLDFYELEHKASINKDSQDCIGLALNLRQKLLKNLSKEYADLDKHLYLATSNKFPIAKIPERYQMCPPLDTAFAKDHATLVIKFTLENDKRLGYIIMDSGYLIYFPVVVMVDALPPHTGRFTFTSHQGGKTFEFNCYNENYVHMTRKNTRNQEQEQTSDGTIHRFSYVGKKLKNVRQIEKRNLLSPFHALVFGKLEGLSAGFYTILKEKDHIVVDVPKRQMDDELTLKSTTENNFTQYKIPFSYILSNKEPRNEEWELALEILNRKYPYGDRFHDLLRRFAVLATDVEFVTELASISNEWNTNLEESLS